MKRTLIIKAFSQERLTHLMNGLNHTNGDSLKAFSESFGTEGKCL